MNDGGAPANGRYDIRLSLLDAAGAKSLAYPLTFSGVEVKNGAFAIDVDFGMDLTRFGALTLKTEVAQGGSGFVALGEPKAFDAKAALGSVCWDTQGNTGLTFNDFLGTNDDTPLVFKSDGLEVARFEIVDLPSTNRIPTITLGDPDNYASGLGATISGGGGDDSFEAHYAGGDFSVISGGYNSIASGDYASVGGGSSNEASGRAATVVSGVNNCAGADYSLAMGANAKVRPANDPGRPGISFGCDGLPSYPGGNGDQGTFVWADSQSGDFISTNDNQFLVRADGGVGINGTPAVAGLEMNVFGTTPFDGFVEFALIPKPSLNGNTGERIEFGVGKGGAGTNDADLRIAHRNDGAGFFDHLLLDGDGSVTVRSNPANLAQGVQLAIGAGAWSSLSDRNLKTDVQAIDTRALLDRLVAMPVQQWRYIGQPGEVKHIGPMAQDFAAAFGVGENDTTISTVDADGVALAAIQGLNAKLEAENTELHRQLQALAARLAALEAAKER